MIAYLGAGELRDRSESALKQLPSLEDLVLASSLFNRVPPDVDNVDDLGLRTGCGLISRSERSSTVTRGGFSFLFSLFPTPNSSTSALCLLLLSRSATKASCVRLLSLDDEATCCWSLFVVVVAWDPLLLFSSNPDVVERSVLLATCLAWECWD
jgi:hypothetical protein